ncbi:hypothetical protein [Mucilaginibacter polytrichastri]|uniref:Uncharacterized protein n=1 Tax=Mucilaginibacter polytrichastri TaxID=1302689 RepID=A0A1Q6A255_9SPHI|nr:hypothetical protein [Mucilaginibacter polytrichastri]OKS88089.1 hypothetical protein RG47T_3553 [Mucilaginibacter polytrichastri]SFT09834.1 hypothetical protein SAMN04487890_110152 [Mucilaginibacter polytrichastri]
MTATNTIKLDNTLEISSEIGKKWVLSDYVGKQKIQTLVFPDGITFSKKKKFESLE